MVYYFFSTSGVLFTPLTHYLCGINQKHTNNDRLGKNIVGGGKGG